MPNARDYLRKFLGLHDEIRFSRRNLEAGDRIILSSKIAGLASDFGLYVENYNSSRNALDALARLKESLKLANSGKMEMAASALGDATRLVARLVVAETGRAQGKEQNG